LHVQLSQFPDWQESQVQLQLLLAFIIVQIYVNNDFQQQDGKGSEKMQKIKINVETCKNPN